MLKRVFNPDAPYTVSAAAEALGVSEWMVRYWVRTGELLRAPVRGDAILISAESVDRLRRARELNPPRRGRKPRRKSTRV